MSRESEATVVYEELQSNLNLPENWEDSGYAPAPAEDETDDWLVGEYYMDGPDVILTVWQLNSGNLQIYYDGNDCNREDEWSDVYGSTEDLISALEQMMNDDSLIK